MMTEPKQPEDQPAPEEAHEMPPHAPHGVPPEAGIEEAKGMPNSDRQNTEDAAHPDKHKPK